MNASPDELFKSRQLFQYLHTEATEMFARVEGIYQVVEGQGFDLPLVQSKIAEMREENSVLHSRLMTTQDSSEMKRLIASIAALTPDVNRLYLVIFDAIDQKLQFGAGPDVQAARDWIAQIRGEVQSEIATAPSEVVVH